MSMQRKSIAAKRALNKLQIGREKFSACLCTSLEDSYHAIEKGVDDPVPIVIGDEGLARCAPLAFISE